MLVSILRVALIQCSDEGSLLTTWSKIKFNKVTLHKAAAKGKICKGHSRGREVSVCSSAWEKAE